VNYPGQMKKGLFLRVSDLLFLYSIDFFLNGIYGIYAYKF
jgi:hypothetical protein